MKNRRPETQIPGHRLATLFLICAAAAGILMSAVILFSPDDVPKAAPCNLSGNIMNGGRFASGEDIAFYSPPGGGIYRLFGGVSAKIGDAAGTDLYAAAEGLIYSSEGNVLLTLQDGSITRTLLEHVSSPVVIGRWIYFLDEGGQLCKSRIDDKRRFSLGLYPRDGRYYISVNRIFYIGDGDKLYTAKTDGSESRLLADYPMTEFMLHNTTVFFRSPEGTLRWFNTSDIGRVSDHAPADSFQFLGNTLLYLQNGKLYATDFQSMNTVLIDEGDFGPLYADGTYLYCFDAQNRLIRMLPDGSEKTVIE